jgi:DNA-binding response OmpR family regulator
LVDRGVAPATLKSIMPDPLSDGSLLANLRLLVVEDEFLIALDIERVIEGAGARNFVVASRCSEALQAVADAPFDLAVLDFKLGRETALPIAERLIAAATPFIFLTGATAEAAFAQERYKDILVVAKPFDGATLLAALSKAIGAN